MSVTRRWVPSVVWGAVIVVATSLPGSALPSTLFSGLDKVVHFSLYGVFAFLLGQASQTLEGDRLRSTTRLLLLVAGIMAFAAIDEWHQRWIPGRSADALDWVADVAGATIGASLSYTALARRESRT